MTVPIGNGLRLLNTWSSPVGRNSRARMISIGRMATIAAGAILLALYFWQIFVTMPHLSVFSADTPSFIQKEPQRGPAVYYFARLLFSVWNDFYAIAVAQGLLLGAAAVLLAYSIRRATGSGLLALAAMVVCLFKVSLVVLTQDLASDSLFSIACLGLVAAALLVFDKASPARIALFLLLGFVASFVRSVGTAILWPLVFGLALRLWPAQRRALGTIVVGSAGVYALTAAIGFINYGVWSPQTQAGLALICGATFIADENVPPDISYPHKFAADTVKPRQEYEKEPSWAQKYKIVDQYYCSKSWQIAHPDLVDRSVTKLTCYNRVIAVNEIFKQAALKTILWNPSGYLKMAVVKLVAGVQMFSSYNNYALEAAYRDDDAEARITQIEGYISDYRRPEQNDCNRSDLLLPIMERYADDWRNTSRTLRADAAKPLRDLFDLVPRSTINWLFVGESIIVFGLAAVTILRRRRINDHLAVILLLLLPTWGYLFALCLVINPILRYMDTTSPFVYIALLMGVWGLLSAAVTTVRQAVAGPPPVEQGA